MKKSALTAALAGGSSGDPAPLAENSASRFKTADDHYAFPCLLVAEDAGGSEDTSLADAVSAIDLKTTPIVGSVPTNVIDSLGRSLVSMRSKHRSCMRLLQQNTW